MWAPSFFYRDIARGERKLINIIVSEHTILDVKNQELNRFFQSNAYFTSSLSLAKEQNQLYSICDGSGTSRSLRVSNFKAISEALESWCYWTLRNSMDYGFTVDPSSSGLAAYPGITARSARQHALEEAIERWSILYWWEFGLPCKQQILGNGDNCLTITTPWELDLFIVWRKLENNRYAFGFSLKSDRAAALQQAIIELERNTKILSKPDLKPSPTRTLERRLLFFSDSIGHSLFEQRIHSTNRLPSLPSLIFDAELRGPWSQYSKVWRCLFESPVSRDRLETDSSLFYF